MANPRSIEPTDWVSVPNPDDTFGMPLYEGAAHRAHHALTAGVYAASTESDEPCELVVTNGSAHARPRDTFWNMDAVLQDVGATGTTAVLEHMGGGNFAIATGAYDPEREAFAGVLVGPVFTGPDGTHVAHREECYIGPDNREIEGKPVAPHAPHDQLVRMIVQAHNQQTRGDAR